MKDTIKELGENINERVKSPLIASIIFSWCAWNFKMIIVILSDVKMWDKMNYIDEATTVGNMIVAPLFGAMVYLVVLALRIPYQLVIDKIDKIINENQLKIKNQSKYKLIEQTLEVSESIIKGMVTDMGGEHALLKRICEETAKAPKSQFSWLPNQHNPDNIALVIDGANQLLSTNSKSRDAVMLTLSSANYISVLTSNGHFTYVNSLKSRQFLSVVRSI